MYSSRCTLFPGGWIGPYARRVSRAGSAWGDGAVRGGCFAVSCCADASGGRCQAEDQDIGALILNLNKRVAEVC